MIIYDIDITVHIIIVHKVFHFTKIQYYIIYNNTQYYNIYTTNAVIHYIHT